MPGYTHHTPYGMYPGFPGIGHAPGVPLPQAGLAGMWYPPHPSAPPLFGHASTAALPKTLVHRAGGSPIASVASPSTDEGLVIADSLDTVGRAATSPPAGGRGVVPAPAVSPTVAAEPRHPTGRAQRTAPATSALAAAGANELATPSTPCKPIHHSPPFYEDWGRDALKADLRRRAKSVSGELRYGPGDQDVNTSLSNSKLADSEPLYAWDKWIEEQGLDPEWTMSPMCTPLPKRLAREAAAENADNAEGKVDRRNLIRTSDSARLVAICFSEDFYQRICKSEQPTEDRNHHDKRQLRDKQPLWRDIAAAFMPKVWTSDGVILANPTSHEG